MPQTSLPNQAAGKRTASKTNFHKTLYILKTSDIMPHKAIYESFGASAKVRREQDRWDDIDGQEQ